MKDMTMAGVTVQYGDPRTVRTRQMYKSPSIIMSSKALNDSSHEAHEYGSATSDLLICLFKRQHGTRPDVGRHIVGIVPGGQWDPP